MNESGEPCTIAALKLMGIGENDSICQGDPKQIWNAFRMLSYVGINYDQKCGKPCSKTSYSVQKLDYHRNLMRNLDVPDEKYVLWPYFASLKVDTKTEKKVYEFDAATVAVGGSLGLFLGLSSLGILNYWIDFDYERLFKMNFFKTP